MRQRAEVVVEVVDERDAGRDVEADDVLVRDPVEVLDERPEAVAVGGDEDPPARPAATGAMADSQYGRKRATVSLRDSQRGRSAGSTSA